MEHFTEYAIIISNFLLFFVTLALTIVTGIDNHSMAKIAALAISKLPAKKLVKLTDSQGYKGRHEKN